MIINDLLTCLDLFKKSGLSFWHHINKLSVVMLKLLISDLISELSLAVLYFMI